ncbi:unnamed protein product, partial [marine sediment metagenome]
MGNIRGINVPIVDDGFLMRVRLIAYTPDPEIVCARMASVSWRKNAPKDLSIEEAKKILKRVIGYGHVSVIEHASFTFFIDGVSRAFTHQLVRHRLASYTQQSMRYVDLSKETGYYIVPPSIMKKENLWVDLD